MNEFLCTDGKIDCIYSHGHYAMGNGLITKHVGLSRKKKLHYLSVSLSPRWTIWLLNKWFLCIKKKSKLAQSLLISLLQKFKSEDDSHIANQMYEFKPQKEKID